MSHKVKALHALNWVYGNICTRQCPEQKQREHYDRMREIIRGHENYLITHKMFIKIMREKYHIDCLKIENRNGQSHRSWFFHDCALCRYLMR